MTSIKKRVRPTTGSRSGSTGTRTTGTRTTGTRTTHDDDSFSGHVFNLTPEVAPSSIVDLFNEYTDTHDWGKNNPSETSAWADLLVALQGGSSGQDAIAQLLFTMSQNGNFTPEIRDQIREFLLQMISNQDQRQFDISQLQDSRLYNSPTNELARMMGAGISRDAAIQMLSGSAGNIGGVAGSMGAAAPNVPQTSGTMDLQQKQFAVGTAQSAVAMLGQLVDTGLSLAQGVESVKAMQSANYFTQAQMQGFSSANELVNALETMQISGQLDSSEIEKLSNGNDLVKYLNKIAPNNEAVKQLLGSNAYKGTFGSIYGRDFFNNYWDSVRKTRDSGTLADEFIRSQHLNNDIAALQPTKIAAEIEAIGQSNKESEQRIIESCTRVAQGEAQIEVLNAQGEWIRVQTELYPELTQSQIDLNEANAAVSRTTNKQLSLNYEYNAAGFPMLKQNRIDELTIKAESWSAIKKYYNNDMRDINGQTPKERYLDAQVRAWLQSPENAADAAYLQSIYLNAAGDFATQHPGLYGLSSVFNQLGVFDLIKTAAEVGVAGSRFIP